LKNGFVAFVIFVVQSSVVQVHEVSRSGSDGNFRNAT